MKRKAYPEGVPGPSIEASKALLLWSRRPNDGGTRGWGFQHLAKEALKPEPWDTGGENMEHLRQECYWVICVKNPEKLKQEAQTILDWIHGNWLRRCTDVYDRRTAAVVEKSHT